jgi:DNA-binding MarR family transcriptional regulator
MGGKRARDTPERQAVLEEILGAEDELTWTSLRLLPPAIVGSGLTWTQLRALFTVAFAVAPTVGRVAELLRVGRSTASVMIDRLVRAGLVERDADPADRRRTRVRLARDGRDMVSRMLGVRRSMYRRYAVHLSDDELRALATAVRALLRAAQVELARAEAAPDAATEVA